MIKFDLFMNSDIINPIYMFALYLFLLISCIACFKPREVILTKKIMKTCFINNPHGAGIAYASDNNKEVIVEKGFFHFRKFWHRLQELQINRTMLIHFRVATSGVIDKINCHPWRIDDKHALIHNGVVQHKIGLDSKDFSDTGLFVEHVLKPTFQKNNKVWKSYSYKWILEKAMGKNNKFVIIDNKENVVIFNEDEGEWHNGIWFSNDTYKNARKSLAKLSNTWMEERNGHIMIAKRNGSMTKYSYVKNPLTTETTKKIMKFAEQQIKQLTPIEDEFISDEIDPSMMI
jgi:hypothetical protein